MSCAPDPFGGFFVPSFSIRAMPLSATSPPRLVTLVLLTGLSVLSLNMFLPSLANMADEFGVPYPLMALAIAGYLASTAVMMLVAGPASDRFGRRPVLLTALSIFTLASAICLATGDVWVFLGFRVLQGAVICGSAVSIAVIGDTAPEAEAASRIGYLTMAMAVVPMLGPTLGGILDEVLGWRASFATFTVLGVGALCLTWIDVGETNRTRSRSFSAQVRGYPALLGSKRYWGYALCMAFSTGAFYAFLAGAPLVATGELGLSTAALGIGMGTMTAGFAVGAFLSGRLSRRRTRTTMMIAGRLVATAGLVLGTCLFLAGLAHPAALFGAVALAGLGNGLTLPSSNAGTLAVEPRLAGSASGLAGALTVGGGALLTTLTGAVVTTETGVYALFAVMLSCAVAGLAAALAVRRAEGRPAG